MIIRFIAVGILLLVLGGCRKQPHRTANTPDPLELSLSDIVQRLSPSSDSIYFFNFWATWCRPCIDEIPDMEKFAAKYANQKVKLVFINVDFPQQFRSKVVPFVAQQRLKSPVWMLNPQGLRTSQWLSKIETNWQGSIPATLIVAPAQSFRRFYEQPLTIREMEMILEDAQK